MSELLSKQGQPSSYSPRTLENSRRRLGNFLNTFTSLASPLASSKRGPRNLADLNNSPIKARVYQLGQTASSDVERGDIEDRWSNPTGVRIDSGVDIDLHHESSRVCLLDLPEEILNCIFWHLRPGAKELGRLSSVSTAFHHLAQSPALWAELYHSTPGYKLSSAAENRGVAVSEPPSGTWNGLECTPGEDNVPTLADLKLDSTASSSASPIPIHYPTLYRARHALSHHIRNPCPEHRTGIETLKGHSDSVYCVQPAGRWLFTGSRDRSIRIWLLGGYDSSGQPEKTILVKVVPDAHSGSVLCLAVDINEIGQGVMISGSSDNTARVWDIDLDAPGDAVALKATLTGHTLGVLSVAFTPRHIVTCSKDCTTRVYDRVSHSLKHVLTGHERAVNAIAPSPQAETAVSASGDGTWRIWDLETGTSIREGGKKGGSGLACIAWKNDWLITGDNASERSVKMYRASTGLPLASCSGHTGLIRAVSLDTDEGLVASGSYDAAIRIWDLHTGRILRKFTNGSPGLVFDVRMSFNRLYIARNDGNAEVISLVTGLPYLHLMT